MVAGARVSQLEGGQSDPELTIAVLNYDGRELLETMLASLERQTYEHFRVIVIDNGSQDDSLAYLSREWPAAQVVAIERNVGVTAALNIALRAARGSHYIGLFNNDMELDPNCLREMMYALMRYPDAGSATPKMIDFTERTMIDGAGDVLNWRGGGERRGHGERDRGQYDEPSEVFGACGGAAIYRRSALDAVGDFDEAYFAYYEDLDWAFRAQLAGFSCRYVPTAVLYHRGSATLGRGMNDFNGYHLWRNAIWLVVKCYPSRALVRHAPSLLRGQLGNLYTAARVKRLSVWRRATRDAVLGVRAAIVKRRAIGAKRTISIAELERVVAATRER
jgi:GT2 family glycosyltransferase